MIKSRKILMVLMILVLPLSACTQISALFGSSESTAASGTPQPLGEFELSQPMRLALGTLKLEETNLAVQAEQAAELLPIWKAYNNLSTSSTAAAAELEALIAQIEETMTPEQMQAIQEMDLTGASMAELFQSLGLDNFRPQGTPDPNQEGDAFQPGGAGMPPGGEMGPGMGMGPGGGGFGGEGLSADPSMQATREAFMATRQASGEEAGGPGFGRGLNPMLLQALIDLLNSKTQGE